MKAAANGAAVPNPCEGESIFQLALAVLSAAGGGMWMTRVAVTGDRNTINPELWHACAGPLVMLPPVGSLVVYFPQGHSEQVKRRERQRGSCEACDVCRSVATAPCLLPSVTKSYGLGKDFCF